MKLRYLLPCAVALLGLGMADAQSVSTSSIPHLEKRGRATQLMVDGRPFLILAGELSNSASSSMEYMQPYWSKLAAANMNTVLAAVTWELVEPEPGKYDFALVGWRHPRRPPEPLAPDLPVVRKLEERRVHVNAAPISVPPCLRGEV